MGLIGPIVNIKLGFSTSCQEINKMYTRVVWCKKYITRPFFHKFDNFQSFTALNKLSSSKIVPKIKKILFQLAFYLGIFLNLMSNVQFYLYQTIWHILLAAMHKIFFLMSLSKQTCKKQKLVRECYDIIVHVQHSWIFFNSNWICTEGSHRIT